MILPYDTEQDRRRAVAFLNWGHLLDHYVILIFPTVVIGLEAVYGRSYGDLITLSTAAFTAFGLFALPAGWLADRWSRRKMIAVFFIGTGLCAIGVGLSQNFVQLSVALCGVGIFAAIYHPVGTPMLVDSAISRSRTVALWGVFGNVGVSVASGITAALAGWFGWRWAFFIPAAVFLVSGVVFLRVVPEEHAHHRARLAAQDVALDMRLAAAVIGLFLTLSLVGGLIFNAFTIMLPKLVAERVGASVPLALAGSMATVVFLCGAATQLGLGRLLERVRPHFLVAVIAVCQLIGIMWSRAATGIGLLLGLAVAISAIYGQLTVNDTVLARYTPGRIRGRIYALRFFLTFTSAGPAVWAIGRLYDAGGFDLVLWASGILAAIYVVVAVTIGILVHSAERKPVQEIAPAE
jgi:MFS family permease